MYKWKDTTVDELYHNDKQPLPNAKSKQPLAASSNQLLTRWHDTSNVEALTVWAQYASLVKYTRRCKKMKKNCEKGTIIARHSGDVMVLAWKDAKIVSMISTFHDNSTHGNKGWRGM
ncbi:hypothetical protein EVAR_91794_1 [Eumeta japonica]|uniref:PiggyBac transposable element-derived protein domain-containing protein n=1 Tax=Eumeta variegata TaxID=151549 RepID=A0A4C1T4I5_EUMVA|nr:hypothetical protein EVAR_91794_1 [Eumeta japonica]